MRKSVRRLAVVGSTAALCTGLTVPAFASQPAATQHRPGPLAGVTSVSQGMTAVDAMIAERLATLNNQLDGLSNNTTMNSTQLAADRARIEGRITALGALGTQVGAETTVAGMRADLNAFWLTQLKSWVGYRVDVVVARLTARMDQLSAAGSTSSGSTASAGQSAQTARAIARIQGRIAVIQALRTTIDSATTLPQARAEWTVLKPLLAKATDRDAAHRGDAATKSNKASKSTTAAKHSKHGKNIHHAAKAKHHAVKKG